MTAAERAKALTLVRKMRAAQDLVDLMAGEIALFADVLRSKGGHPTRRYFASDLEDLAQTSFSCGVIWRIERIEALERKRK